MGYCAIMQCMPMVKDGQKGTDKMGVGTAPEAHKTKGPATFPAGPFVNAFGAGFDQNASVRSRKNTRPGSGMRRPVKGFFAFRWSA